MNFSLCFEFSPQSIHCYSAYVQGGPDITEPKARLMTIDFKFASLVISLFCHLLSPPFISDMAYTRRTLQLEERIYAVPVA